MSSTGCRLWVVAARLALLLLLLLARPSHARPEPPETHHCPNCVHPRSVPDARALETLRIEGIKQQILSKLGLRAKPNVTSGIPREVLLQTLYRSEENRELLAKQQEEIRSAGEELLEDDYYAKTSEIISFAVPGPQVNNYTLLEFTQSEADVTSLRVTEALLWVFLRRPPGARHHDPARSKTMLWVFRVPPGDVRKGPSAQLVTSLHLSASHVGWHRLDVTSAVQRWFARPGERLRLLVDCSSCSGELEAALFTARKLKGAHKPGSRRSEASHRPFLVVHTAPTPSRRLSRRALQCDKDTKMCCKQNLFISFRELGWDDWIIAPTGYNANYCKGSCASVFRTLDTFPHFHSQVMEEVRRHRPAGSLEQCCAPTKLSPMSLIYQDEFSNIIKRNVPRMVVEECGCA
ncbi:inhibin beta chain-like [Portunus trituberculatus]|uniref:inhibin beta chain-like n=1 Tax=Portunus trituberculatus TaxID=210409 RepID=UPI001E1D1ABA|nr:inhibin beta chain-like [Portunus trituberculatus]